MGSKQRRGSFIISFTFAIKYGDPKTVCDVDSVVYLRSFELMLLQFKHQEKTLANIALLLCLPMFICIVSLDYGYVAFRCMQCVHLPMLMHCFLVVGCDDIGPLCGSAAAVLQLY